MTSDIANGHAVPHTNGVPDEHCIVARGVSKFYGEVLGVNRVDLRLPPGVTSLVGPNGAGKSTLMNLMAGLVRPTAGEVRMLGLTVDQPEELFKILGYCTQVDAFPPRLTGIEFVRAYLRFSGISGGRADELAWRAIERTDMERVEDLKVGGYSKGMRQRIKLAQAIAQEPPVLLLDEPLNGLDPLARAEVIDLFRILAREGLHLVISSHILHEVDVLSDRMVVMDHGYVVAEGGIAEVRAEIDAQPIEIVIRGENAKDLAARIISADHVTEIRITDDGDVVVRTRDAAAFYALLQSLVVAEGFAVHSVTPTDEDAQAIYRYLVTGKEDTE